MRVIDTDRRIAQLEAAGDLEEARAVRSSALQEGPSTCLGPLWRSEGEDRLYRLKDYPGALAAFENALVAMEDSALLYGVSQSDRVLYGAALAAILMGDWARAEKYYHRFVELVDSLRSDPKLAGLLEWHEKSVGWLRGQIQGEQPDGSEGSF
ncbi:MAG: tol-pal system YbgF family protein [Nitrospinota bacterium]